MFKLIIVCIVLFQLTTAVPPQFQTANGKLTDSNLATGLETAKELLKNLKMTALKLNSIDSQLKEGKRDLTENGTFSSSSISGSSVAADVGSSLTVGFDLLNNLKAAAALLNGLKQAAHDVAEAADEKILGKIILLKLD
jgi:Zn-dependent membrane protease YugP